MDLAVQRVFVEDRTPWQEPAIKAEALEEYGLIIMNRLAERPTPRRLDTLLAKYPNFQLHQGGRLGYTVLQVAIEANALPLIRHILTIRPDLVDAYWHEQQLPQIFKATKSWNIFYEFIKRGANIHARSRSLDTALGVATVGRRDMAVVRYLLRSGAVINELHRQSILAPDSHWDEIHQRQVRKQPVVVRRGLEQILGEDLFLQGHFPLPVTKETTIQLPPEIRALIWRFMTNFWNAPSLENRVLFPLLESETRKMQLIDMLATQKIDGLCKQLAAFSTKVEDAIAELSKNT